MGIEQRIDYFVQNILWGNDSKIIKGSYQCIKSEIEEYGYSCNPVSIKKLYSKYLEWESNQSKTFIK